MTRIAFAGFETGADLSDGLTTTGTATTTYDTAIKRSGASSLKIDSGASNLTGTRISTFSGAVDTRYFATIWIYVPAASGFPAVLTTVLSFYTGATALCHVRLLSTGKIRLVDAANVQIGSDSSATLSTNTWHRIDLGVEIGTGAIDYCECRLDGVSVASSTSQSLSDAAPTNVRMGIIVNTPGANKIFQFDDYVLNDDNGSVHNTWAGDEKVVLLVPTADSARDTNWILGAGGTTNVWEAVNNIPPVGVATASATNTSQVENAASTTTEEYDATMTTYTAAGVGSTDTMTAIQGFIVAGSSSTTGSDTIGIEVESNPAIAELATASVDSITVTFPTGWIRGNGTIAENPSVTVGTAPVLSIRKNFATTRIHQVCFMGMYASYVVSTSTPQSAPDTETLDYAETASATAAITAADTETLDYVDTATLAATASATDAETLDYVDTTRIGVANADVETLDYVDTASVAAALTATDAETLDYVDTATLAAALTNADAETLDYVDTATLAATATATDTQALTASDAATIAVAKDAPDTQALTASDTATLAAALAVTDSETLDYVDTATLATALAAADTETLDYVDIASKEESGGDATKSAPDTQALTAADIATIAAALTKADTETLDYVDTATVAAALSAADTQALTASDAATVAVPKAASDTNALTAVTTATVAVAVTAVDSQALTASDAALLAAAFSVPDTQALTALDVASMVSSAGVSRQRAIFMIG